MLKKGKFEWIKETEVAFENMKKAVTTTPVLALPNFREPFVIETNALGDGLGTVLTQNKQPINYMSRHIKTVLVFYSKEMLVIIMVV